MLKLTPSPLQRYGVAVLLSLLALLLSLLLWQQMDQSRPLLFLVAVMVSAWYGGLGPGLLTTTLSSMATAYFFLPPLYSPGVGLTDDFIELGLFVLAAVLVSSLNSARKRAEVTLASIGDAVILSDKEGAVTFMNSVAQTLTGWKQEEAIGKSREEIFRIINEETHSEVQNPAVKVTRERTLIGQASHKVLIARNGAKRPIDDSEAPIRDDQGNIIGVVLVFRDITERKRAEEKLQESERRSRQLAENIREAFWMFDPRKPEMIYISPAYEEIWGRTSLSLYEEPKSFLDTIHPEDRKRVMATLNKQIRGENTDVQYRIVRPDGSVRWIWDRGYPIQDDSSGEVYRIAGIAEDITERKQAEEALARHAEELARSNAELEQFAYVASHDLQEPLRMVAGFAQLLAKRYQGKLGADADEFIRYVVDGVSQMHRLIHDLLDYSRVGKKGKNFKPTDCQTVLDRTLGNLQGMIEETGAQVTFDPLPTVMADLTQMAQLFQNLISNAIKFRGQEPPCVHVSAEQRGRQWVFSIRDNGIGIDPKYANRIFAIFQRLHNKKDYPGSGIGLAICKKIVEYQGGRIWVESQPGQGATFYFTLPSRRRTDRGGVGARPASAGV